MSLLISLVRNIFTIALCTPITIFQTLFIAKYILKKNNIIIYHHGWGVGHTLHDVEYIRTRYSPNKTAVIFFNNGKHNKLLTKAFTDVSVFFIDVFINIPVLNKKLTLRKNIALLLHNLFISFCKKFFSKSKTIITIDDLREKIMNENNIPYSQVYKLMGSEHASVDRVPLILPKDIQKKVEHKINIISDNSIDKEEIVAVYHRKKGTDSDQPDELLRSSGDISDYFKMFDYLLEKNYMVFLYGDYLYEDLKKFHNYKLIITHERIKVDKHSLCLYASLKCQFFITASGGGASFPFSRKNYPQTLALNAYPFDFVLPNATVVYKNVVKKNGELINGNILIEENLGKNFLTDQFNIVNNSSDLILDSTIEFFRYCKNDKRNNLNFKMNLSEENIHKKYSTRISPIWLRFNEK